MKQISQDNQTKSEHGLSGSSVTYPYINTSDTNVAGESSELRDMVTIPSTPMNDTSFFMSVKLDNTRVIRDLQKYLDEVIMHLSSVDGCEVELSLEVGAKVANGFPQGTVRTVSENCRTLRMDNFGFEK